VSVYVDKLANHGWRLGPSCHMIADTLDELHAMAQRIGLKREWFQPKSTPHYDLTASRRARAVTAGAIECGRVEFVRKLRALRAAAQRYVVVDGCVRSDPMTASELRQAVADNAADLTEAELACLDALPPEGALLDCGLWIERSKNA